MSGGSYIRIITVYQRVMQFSTSTAKQVLTAMVAVAVVATALNGGLLGAVEAQGGNGTTTTDTNSDYNCNETTEIVVAVLEDGNATETVSTAWLNYTNRVERVASELRQEYEDNSGIDAVSIPADPNTTVCGKNVSQVGVHVNSEFDGTLPDQRYGVDIVNQGPLGPGGHSGGSLDPADRRGDDPGVDEGENSTESESVGDGPDATTEETTTGGATQNTGDEGKAKQPSGGDDDDSSAADGGNGKAKMDDSGDGDGATDGGNGKAKED